MCVLQTENDDTGKTENKQFQQCMSRYAGLATPSCNYVYTVHDAVECIELHS